MNAEAPAPATVRRLFPLLLMLSAIGPTTMNVFQASMPGLAVSLNAPRETVQLILSLYILGMAVAQLVAGPLSDRFGRRPVVLVGLSLYIVASAVAVFSQSIEALIGARIAQALGATACLSLSRTVIGDISDRATTARMIAYVTMVMVVAPMAAPNIGSALDIAFGWPSILMFCVLLGVVTLAAAALALPETRPATLDAATYADVARRTLALARNPTFLRYAALSSMAAACFFIFLGGAPHLVIEAMGRSPTEFGYWYILLGIGYSLGNFTVARATHLFGPERMMGVGSALALLGVVIIGVLALAAVQHPAALFVPAMLFTFGNGLVMPHAMAAAIQTDRNAAGAASGLVGFSQMLVGAGFSYLVARLPGETALPMAVLMMLCGIVALVLMPLRRRKG